MPPALLTTRRAVPADAETLVRTSRLGQETWRAFAPAGRTRRVPRDHREVPGGLARDVREERRAVRMADDLPGTSRARRCGWRADTLAEVHDGMPWAIYGRPLLPVAGAARENPAVDAGVRSRP